VSRPALPDFTGLAVAVLGDLVADHYLHAEPTRLSREAPVMVLRHRAEQLGAGGAANVARNLAALGARVSVFGAVGRDRSGRELVRLLEDEVIDCAGVRSEVGWTTPTKTRVLAAEARRFPQQVLRIDREPEAGLDAAVAAGLAEELRGRASEFDALLLSDYDYGLVGPALLPAVRAFDRRERVVVLDPRQQLGGLGPLRAVTPNVGELARFTGRSEAELDEPSALRAAARELQGRHELAYLLVTRGNLGMALFGPELEPAGVAVPASGEGEVTDVSGAGDTAAAVFALALAGGVDPVGAMRLANAAAGVVVMENGTAVCTRAELEGALVTSPPAARLSAGPRS